MTKKAFRELGAWANALGRSDSGRMALQIVHRSTITCKEYITLTRGAPLQPEITSNSR
jgi:hypothetical protein